MATQNPIEMEGTYPLPEAQRDRFMARISMGYPAPRAELDMLDSHGGDSPLDELTAGHRRRHGRPLIVTVRTGLRQPGGAAVHRRPRHRDPRSTPALRLGRLPARQPAPAAGVAGPRRARGPRPRAARRRAGARRARARAPAHAHGRDPARAALHGDVLPRSCDGPVPAPCRARRAARSAPGPAEAAPVSRVRDVLTVRGRAFVAAGLTLVLAGVMLGFPDITRFGVLLIGLPLLAAARDAPQPAPVRRAAHAPSTPRVSRVDQSAGVDDRLRQHLGAAHAGLPGGGAGSTYVLGDRPRFVAAPHGAARAPRGGTTRSARTCAAATTSGHSALRVRDPFGLATGRRRAAGDHRGASCCPACEPLGGGHPRGDGVGAEGAIPHMVALHGEDDVTIRSTATATTCGGSTGRPRRTAAS